MMTKDEMSLSKYSVLFFLPSAWMVIGMIGAFLFILIQLILLVDFAHSWNENWIRRHEDSESKIWFIGENFFTFDVRFLFMPTEGDGSLNHETLYCTFGG